MAGGVYHVSSSCQIQINFFEFLSVENLDGSYFFCKIITTWDTSISIPGETLTYYVKTIIPAHTRTDAITNIRTFVQFVFVIVSYDLCVNIPGRLSLTSSDSTSFLPLIFQKVRLQSLLLPHLHIFPPSLLFLLQSAFFSLLEVHMSSSL